MSQPFDLSRFPDLPPEVVTAFAAQQTALEAARFDTSVERAARQHAQAMGAEKDAFITDLKALIEKLEGQVQQYRHAKFGPKSEKLDPAQLELALEDLETAITETQAQIAAVEEKIAASEPDPEKRKPRAPRKARARPEHLPRVERLGHLPVAGEVEQRRRWRTTRERAIFSDIAPEPGHARFTIRKQRHRRVVAVQAFGLRDVGPDQRMDRSERGRAGADLIGQPSGKFAPAFSKKRARDAAAPEDTKLAEVTRPASLDP